MKNGSDDDAYRLSVREEDFFEQNSLKEPTLQALQHSSLEPTFSSQVDFLKLLHILDTDFLYTAWMYKNNYMKHHYSYKCFSRILEA